MQLNGGLVRRGDGQDQTDCRKVKFAVTRYKLTGSELRF